MSKVKIMPLTLLDKCIGTKLWVVMKGKREFAGTLRGFDDFFNMVLENAVEIWEQDGERKRRQAEAILLNGHDVVYVSCWLARWSPGRTLWRRSRGRGSSARGRSEVI